MSIVQATATCVDQEFPEGTTQGVFHFEVIDIATNLAVEAVNSPTPDASFTITAPGEYTVTAIRWDANNQPLGTLVTSAPVTISAQALIAPPATIIVSISVPSALTVTVTGA